MYPQTHTHTADCTPAPHPPLSTPATASGSLTRQDMSGSSARFIWRMTTAVPISDFSLVGAIRVEDIGGFMMVLEGMDIYL